MADIQANIGIGVDTSQALAQIRQLQREISAFHTSMAKGGALANAESARLSQNLINSINSGGKFAAGMTQISSSTESFTNALEKNKLSMAQYFRYAGGASKSFGKMFSREFNTINRVATERVKDLQTQYISMGRDANGALQSIKVRPLALDMNDLGTKVQMVAQKQQIFNQLLKQGSTNLLNFGKNTQWAGRQLMVGFTIPLTIFGATAAREFQKLEEQAVKFRRVYGDMFTTDAETEQALQNIRELADEFTKYGIAVEKTVGLAAKVAQMGNVGTDLTAQVTQATRLAVLGGLEQEEALDTTISLTNAFGVAAEDLAGKIAFLNAAENQTILAIEDFNEAIPKAGSVVQQLGGDVEDLAFMLTAMREGGVNASEAANAIKSSLGRMINPTEAAKKKLSSFGIDIMGIVENNAGNLQATIMQLGYALEALDPLERARAIETLFGKFQFARMSTMFQNIVKDGSQANKVLGLTANSTEELAIIAERELKRVEDSVGFKFQKQLEKLQAALAPIGEEFLKAITPVVEFGTRLLKSFNNLGDGAKQFVVVLTAIAGVVAPAALMAFGLIANGVANLIKFISLLGKGFGLLSGQSRILGTGTEYMTQQQIEAAAVAASLGQSHTNLIQVFTAEATAIRNLANAYREAIIAQGAFTGTGAAAAAASNPKAKGFASGGIIRGPGTGTSDSIFAMLSNGEAVIPAAVVRENPELVNQLIAGNIPGYSKGVNLLGKTVSSSGDAKDQQAIGRLAARLNQINEMIPGVLDDFAKGLTDNMSIASEAMKRRIKDSLSQENKELVMLLQYTEAGGGSPAQSGMVKSHGGGEGRKVTAEESSRLGLPANSNLHNDLVFGESAAANANLLTGKERGQWFRENPGQTSAYLQEQGYVDLNDEQQAKDYNQFSQSVAAQLEAAGGEVTESQFQEIVAAGIESMAEGAAKEGMRRASETFTTYSGADPKNPKKRRNLTAGDAFIEDDANVLQRVSGLTKPDGSKRKGWQATELPASVKAESNKKADQAIFGVVESRAEKQGVAFEKPSASDDPKLNQESKELTQRMRDIGKDAADGLAGGTEESLEIQSPSRRMFRLGEAAADGLAQGFETGMQDNTDPLAPPKPPEVSYSASDPSQPGGIRGKLRNIGNRAADKFNDSAIGQGIGRKFADMTGTPLADSQGNLVYDPNAVASSGAPMPVRIVEGFELAPEFQEMAETGQIKSEKLADTLQENTQATNQSNLTEKEKIKTDKAQKRQALAGRMMAGLGGITMAAGMATQAEGIVGEVAQGLVGPLAAITGILPMLTAMGPLWGTLLAVIGGGIALWMLHNKAMEKARTEAYELARAMGTGKDAIQKFADFSGRVTSSEIAAQRRQNRQNPLQLQPGQKTFGSAFVEDEAGQALVENTRKSLQKLGKDATIQSLYTQLGTAVTQGALSSQEAISIAAALSQEIGDYGIGMSVNAKLIELLGPNGENVLTEPLKIETQAKLTKDSVEASAETLARSFSTIELFSSPAASPGSRDQYLGGSAQGPTLVFDEVAQALIDAEAERQSEDAGWWDRNIAIPFKKATGVIADELRAGAIGTSMGVFANNLDLASQAIDAQRLSSQNLIDEAIKNGATESDIADLKQQEADAIDELMQSMAIANQQLFDWWNDLPESDRATTRADQEKRIKAQAEEKGLDATAVGADLVRLRSKTGDAEEMRVNMVIRTAIESGALSEQNLSSIVDNFNNPEDKEIISDLILGVGPGETGNLLAFLEQIDDETLKADILLGFKGADTETSLERISDLDYLYRTSPIFDGVEIPINFYTTGEGDLEKTMDMADEIRNKAATGQLFQDGEIDMGAYADVVGEDIAARAAVAADAIGEEFDALDEAGKLEFFTNFAINAQFTGDPDAIAFYKSKAQEMNLNLDFGTTGSKKEQQAADIVSAKQTMKYISQTKPVNAPGTDNGEDAIDSGGGGKEALDDLLVGLRNVRQATIDMKRGWDGMQESLQKFLDSGATGFNGLANQMRRVGVGENLIERITGMDPDEYEKRKGELFVFDEAGNIVGTTQKLQNMAAAMNKLALGDYVNQQQAFIENTNNQFTAMNKLTAAGLSFVDAYEMVQDQALATAIAMSASRAEVEELIRITEKMNEMRDRYDRLSEEQQAAKAVRQTNQEFNNRVAVLNKLAQQQGKYTDEEINAILNDSNLSTLFLNPKIDAKTLKKALENARRAADLELRIKVATEEGKAGLAQELMAGVQDEFSRQETKIELAVGLATKDDQKIVDEAQNTIAAIQYQIDDYEAQLKGIEDQEEVINEKYDERFKALDEVAKANERINQAQQAQLDIADALSRGDIAAAARAQQQLRSQQAQSAEETRRESLQKQQAAEIAAIRSQSGMSREQIEDKVKSLQDEIFGIEESQLEPAQERIRIAEYNKQLQIDALEVSGKTRDEWSQIANLTDIASQNTEEFALNVERALALYEHLVNGAALDTSLFGGDMDARLEAMGINIKEERAVSAAIAAANNIDTSGPVTTKQEKMKDLADQLKALDIQLKETAGYTDGRSRADIIAQQRDISKQFAELALGADAIKMGAISINQLENAWAQAGRTVINTPPPSSSSNNRRPSNSSSNRTTQIITPTVVPKNASPAVQSAIRKENAAINRINQGGPIGGLAMGGLFRGFGMGGKVKGYAAGGFRPLGSDIINARLTPGEFVIKRPAVNKFGVDNLEKINNGTYSGGSVYNYNLAVNVKSNADPDRIANTVMRSIRRIESQKIRGNRF